MKQHQQEYFKTYRDLLREMALGLELDNILADSSHGHNPVKETTFPLGKSVAT